MEIYFSAVSAQVSSRVAVVAPLSSRPKGPLVSVLSSGAQRLGPDPLRS